ncbi:MAG: FAD:protein FMN transferase [Desulfobacteraceae bacterium]
MKHKIILRLMLSAFIGVFSTGFDAVKEHRISGRTMGTTYQIKIVTQRSGEMAAVQERINRRLEQLNQSMSTYLKESEISRFNQMKAVDQPFAVSSDFLKVMQAADTIHRLTKGAWDGTVHPLVDLWGFGRSGPIEEVPSRHAIAAALKRVGFNRIEVSEKGFLKKRQPHVTLDLASIAKGYGVDAVSRTVHLMGFRNYLVEIGGEVYAAGRRLDGNPWRVGINRPRKGAAATAVYKALSLEDRAMATSGDYRNYVEIDGRFYSHIIDPRTGYPVYNGVVSATVVAPNCTLADGLATALMVMGAAEGVVLLDQIESVEGLIILRRPDGTLIDHWSKGMKVKQPQK